MTRINVASVRFATALAHSVLPVPGGPYNMTPLGGSMPRLTKRSGESSGTSTTSRNRSICSLHPPTSEYVTSGFSSTCIIVTEGSIFGGRGSWIEYFCRSTPTRMPSSISVGDTRSPRLTTAKVSRLNRGGMFFCTKLCYLFYIDDVFPLLRIIRVLYYFGI